jgi:hypothetical protein
MQRIRINTSRFIDASFAAKYFKKFHAQISSQIPTSQNLRQRRKAIRQLSENRMKILCEKFDEFHGITKTYEVVQILRAKNTQHIACTKMDRPCTCAYSLRTSMDRPCTCQYSLCTSMDSPCICQYSICTSMDRPCTCQYSLCTSMDGPRTCGYKLCTSMDRPCQVAKAGANRVPAKSGRVTRPVQRRHPHNSLIYKALHESNFIKTA